MEGIRQSVVSSGLVAVDEGVVVGVSGGPDSVALLHLLIEIGARCQVVHVNYRLRAEDSELDSRFVEEVCANSGVPVEIIPVGEEWLGSISGTSLQEAARDFRYRVFEEVANRTDIQKVAVAHHLDDQVETVLLRLFRGTGLAGAAGMRPRRPISDESEVELVRPLLGVTRENILAWLADRNLAFRDDSSNVDPRYERVRLRESVVPAIVESFGRSALRNIARFADHAGAAVDTAVTARLEVDLDAAATDTAESGLRIDILKRHDAGWRDLILLEAIRRWMPDAPERATVVRELAGLLDAEAGKRVVFGASEAWRARDSIVFVRSSDRDRTGQEVTLGVPVHLTAGALTVERVDNRHNLDVDNPNVEVVDARLIDEVLTVGRWRQGDRFQPLGMKGSKLVSDFLTDERVAPHEKAEVLVVRSGGEIVWVVGYRIDHRYRVTEETAGMVRLRFEPG